jgi:hypothetical protein
VDSSKQHTKSRDMGSGNSKRSTMSSFMSVGSPCRDMEVEGGRTSHDVVMIMMEMPVAAIGSRGSTFIGSNPLCTVLRRGSRKPQNPNRLKAGDIESVDTDEK